MRVAEEANLYGVWIKIVRSDGLQVDVREANGDPFHVLGYYGLTAHRWKVTKCITRNAGRMVYGPGEKDRMKGKGKSCGKETIPPLAVADLAPPPPDEQLVMHLMTLAAFWKRRAILTKRKRRAILTKQVCP